MSNKLQILEDEIGRHLKVSEASGELKKTAGFGQPLDFGDGYQETPEELRMGYKILKDAGYSPPEVEMMKTISSLREELKRTHDSVGQEKLKLKILDLDVSLTMAKERLTRSFIR